MKQQKRVLPRIFLNEKESEAFEDYEEDKPMIDATLQAYAETNSMNGTMPTDKNGVPLMMRNRSEILRKYKTIMPIGIVYQDFTLEQQAKGNSAATIAYYKRCFKKLSVFLAYTCATPDDYKEMEDDTSSLQEYGNALPITTLEMDDLISDYRTFLTEVEDVNEQTVNSYLRGLKALVNFCVEKDYIEPVKIVIRDIDAPIKDTYTDDELQRLLKKPANDDNFADYRNWVIINYFMGTGNRVASVSALKVGDIDFEEETVTVIHQKNHIPLVVSIPSRLVRVLREYVAYWRCDDDGNPLTKEPLFCNKYGEAMTPNAIKIAVAAYNKSRGVNKTSCHLFRHTYAKRWILEGKDIIQLAKVLNHRNLKMVQRYANLWGTDLKPAVEEASLLSLVKRKSGDTLQTRKKLQKRRM